MADYQLLLRDPFGNLLAPLDGFIDLDYARIVNGIGALTVNLPKQYDQYLFSSGDVRVDNRIDVLRRVGSGAYYLDTDAQWLVRRGVKKLTGNGQRLTTIQAECANSLLKRRIVAYASGAAQADKTGFADDLMKAIIRENFGSLATDTARSIATYLTTQADLGVGGSVSKAFSRRKVLQVLQELALMSFQAGTYLAFDVISTSPSTFEFRTYINQRGIDHRWPGGSNPVILGAEFGNLTNIERGYDHIDEVTYAYAGGQGTGASRAIGTSTDATRVGSSPLNRCEYFTDARASTTAAQLTDEADSALRNGNVRQVFSADFIDTPQVTYGLHVNFGDQVTAVFEGESIDCRVNKIRVSVRNGVERIEAKISNN